MLMRRRYPFKYYVGSTRDGVDLYVWTREDMTRLEFLTQFRDVAQYLVDEEEKAERSWEDTL